MKITERPMSPLLIMLLNQIQTEFKDKLAKAVEVGAIADKIPNNAKANLDKRVWLIPEEDNATAKRDS